MIENWVYPIPKYNNFNITSKSNKLISCSIILSIRKINKTNWEEGFKIIEVLNNMPTKKSGKLWTLEFLNKHLEIRFYEKVVDSNIEA